MQTNFEGESPDAGRVASQEDVRLLIQIVDGDAAAFAAFFDLHSGAVLGLLRRMLGAAGEAEEVLQEVFLQVWRRSDRYAAERASPRRWLLMAARYRALDCLRNRKARCLREEAANREDLPRPVRALGTERLEARERREWVAGALGRLSPDQRLCIELAFFEGLTQTQVAFRVNAPLGTVKSRILLGMKKLRQARLACIRGGGLPTRRPPRSVAGT